MWLADWSPLGSMDESPKFPGCSTSPRGVEPCYGAGAVGCVEMAVLLARTGVVLVAGNAPARGSVVTGRSWWW